MQNFQPKFNSGLAWTEGLYKLLEDLERCIKSRVPKGRRAHRYMGLINSRVLAKQESQKYSELRIKLFSNLPKEDEDYSDLPNKKIEEVRSIIEEYLCAMWKENSELFIPKQSSHGDITSLDERYS